MDMGLMGATVGTAIGLLGAVIGTYCGIKNTKTTAERSFVIKFVIGMWVGVILLIGLPGVLSLTGIIPKWTFWVTCPVFVILFVPTAFWANKRQAALRDETA